MCIANCYMISTTLWPLVERERRERGDEDGAVGVAGRGMAASSTTRRRSRARCRRAVTVIFGPRPMSRSSDLDEAGEILVAAEDLLSQLESVKQMWYNAGFQGNFAEKSVRDAFADRTSSVLAQLAVSDVTAHVAEPLAKYDCRCEVFGDCW